MHCREEVRPQLGVGAAEDFVPDVDARDFGLGEMGLHVLLNPGLGFERVGGHALQVLVAEADDEINLGVREGLEDVRICVVKFD